jgi:hypothetical protein
VNVDRTHKLIQRYAVTDAAVHDSRKFNGLLHQGNTSQDVFGDSAYRSAATEATLKARGFRSRIHVRAARRHPLSKVKAAANRAKSRIRARIEHVSSAGENQATGGKRVPAIQRGAPRPVSDIYEIAGQSASAADRIKKTVIVRDAVIGLRPGDNPGTFARETMAMTFYAALDVSLDKTAVCVMGRDGNISRRWRWRPAPKRSRDVLAKSRRPSSLLG